jgi:phosphoglucomutase
MAWVACGWARVVRLVSLALPHFFTPRALVTQPPPPSLRRAGLLSTPAVSCVIREREGGVAYGGIVLTASHNPGGPEEDFGIKYNCANGGPAPEGLTDAIFAATARVSEIKWAPGLPDVDLDALGATRLAPGFTVEVIDSVADYAAALARVFDFSALRALVARPDFSLAYDGMSGVAGPYGKGILGGLLGVPAAALRNCEPLPDFGGHHPDPNLTYAEDLVAAMGLTRTGEPAAGDGAVPDFGAAQDGDADRNMILGGRFFVTPSDSVAVIAAHADAIPFFVAAGGLKGVARSMPTSCALDRVATARGIPLFEVPTGWKFFGNLMDSAELGKANFNPFLCGEESFGTGSNHVREKDGLWAVLAWLSILAQANAGAPVGRLVSVEAIVREHWARFGRNYYCRYDYEGVDAAAADAVMAHLRGKVAEGAAAGGGGGGSGGPFVLAKADEFSYTDPVDGSVSARQGLRFIYADGSRIVFRLSGTGSVGATLRVYIEKYEPVGGDHNLPTAAALKELVGVALGLAEIEHFTGRKEPTVIT